MNPADRLHITMKLRAILDGVGQLFEDIGDGVEPMGLLHTADEMHNRAAEVLAAVVGLCRQPGEMPYAGANVAIPAERTPAEDKAAQRVVGLEKLEAERAAAEQRAWDSERLQAARAEAGIASVLDDVAASHNSDRDSRGTAA